jgi:hypothetical protein
VCDADGQTVGQFTRGVLRGGLGRRWYVIAQAEGCEFGDGNGPALAVLSRQSSDRVLAFSPESREDPLSRMLALAAAVTLYP